MMTAKKIAVHIALLCTCFLLNHACDHAGVRFGYSGSTGPKHWGSLSPNFTLCSKGIYQSPINIVKDDAVYNPKLEPLERDYTATNATIVDNVFNIALRYNDTAETVVVDGTKYKLKQLHWHSPSEHTINGQRFAVELHMVHYTEDGNITVVAILYRHGKPDPFLFQDYRWLDYPLWSRGCFHNRTWSEQECCRNTVCPNYTLFTQPGVNMMLSYPD